MKRWVAELPSRMLVAVLWLLHWLPLSLLAPLGNALGLLLYVAIFPRRRVVRTNLRLAFPELGQTERERMARRLFANLGRTLLERGLLWWAPRARLERLIRVEGEERVRALLAAGRPVILMAPHFVGLDMGGTRVTMVEGDPSNLKVTEPVDLEFARALHTTEERRVEHETRLRVGNGFDIHRFSEDPGRPLVLGGVTFEGRAGLIGHSDADVVAHAVAEALLGAAGLGDLGSHFPDDDDRFANADSIELLRAVSGEVTAGGWEVANVDCSVIAEHPKLAPAREQMQSRLSAAVGAPVTVKGRRAEGMGDLGRGDGIAATATALLVSAAGRR